MSSTRTKLSKRSVEALKVPSKGNAFAWDTQTPGFGVRLFATGAKVFVLQYRNAAKQQKRVTLGHFPAMSVESARDEAERLRPMRRKRDRAPARETFSSVFPRFTDELRARSKKPRTVTEYERLWTATLAPQFGGVQLKDLTAPLVRQWHLSRHQTPALADRAVSLLHAVCNWCEREGLRTDGNPCTKNLVPRFHAPVKRTAPLKPEEYRRLGSALAVAARVGLPTAPKLRAKSRGLSAARRETLTGTTRGAYAPRAPQYLPASRDLTPANPVAVAVLRFLALSGWRKEEAMSLRWDAIDFERSMVTLADTKSGRSERPLGDAALAVLSAQPKVAGNPYVFPGRAKGQPIRDVKHTWDAVRHAAGFGMKLHGLRHSFPTVGRSLDITDEKLRPMLGHVGESMTAKYGGVPTEDVKRAADTVSAAIAAYLDHTEPRDAKVLPFQPRRATAS